MNHDHQLDSISLITWDVIETFLRFHQSVHLGKWGLQPGLSTQGIYELDPTVGWHWAATLSLRDCKKACEARWIALVYCIRCILILRAPLARAESLFPNFLYLIIFE